MIPRCVTEDACEVMVLVAGYPGQLVLLRAGARLRKHLVHVVSPQGLNESPHAATDSTAAVWRTWRANSLMRSHAVGDAIRIAA